MPNVQTRPLQEQKRNPDFIPFRTGMGEREPKRESERDLQTHTPDPVHSNELKEIT